METWEVDNRETFNVKVTPHRQWIPVFLGMLKTMQTLGALGCSRWIRFFADGDGSFNPKFEWDTEIEPNLPKREDAEGNLYFGNAGEVERGPVGNEIRNTQRRRLT